MKSLAKTDFDVLSSMYYFLNSSILSTYTEVFSPLVVAGSMLCVAVWFYYSTAHRKSPSVSITRQHLLCSIYYFYVEHATHD